MDFLPKAIALYKKVLKLKPDHEHALLQAGEIAASQGLLLDARTFLNALSARYRARGDDRGLAAGPNQTGFARSRRLPGAVRRRARAQF